MTLTFCVPHPPVAAARPRVFGRRAVIPPKTAEAVRCIREHVFAALPAGWVPLDGPLDVTVTAYLPMPGSVPKSRRATALPFRRPDVDNLLKTALDGCSPVWVDDAQVVTVIAAKRYAAVPRWEIEVRPAAAADAV